jgi:tyrosinase
LITFAPRRTLTKAEKASYLKAVNCILAKPSITPKFNGSGVISRYDDLVYTHIQQTFSIHYVGHFLAWHRYFTATYEHMLRSECCYRGAQPYWDWTLDVVPADTLNSTDSDTKWPASPVFDGDTGFGGNGPFVAVDPSNPFAVPGRTGGGCVSDGPWAGKQDLVHLGPQSAVAYNPQCLKRDLSPAFAARYLNLNQTRLTLTQPDFGWFDRVVEGGPSFDTSGVHGGGHYSVGGTLGM